MINYAHRGASEYAPENTLSSFYLGLLQGANGIETDVRKSKDGVPVLFHDKTVDRVTDGTGMVEDLTLAELKELKVYGNSTTGFFDRIVTLREFLEIFSRYDIHFAIELKGEDVEKESLALATEFGIMDRTTFTCFNFERIKKMRKLSSTARIGFLTKATDDEAIELLRSIDGNEMAPLADNVSEELMKKWRSHGLGVRAWGVSSVAMMKKMCSLGVDGMTVNFPGRLSEYLKTL